jgi:hypothetical protein
VTARTTLERGDQIRAGGRQGSVLDVGESACWAVLEWAPYDDILEGEYDSALYEVPDMHHVLPHLEVLRDERWQLVTELDSEAARS